ncbi:aminoacyl-tRNA hydrolase [Granulosicoccaceae sp. 1_MG-2023]|nr:aminoacyl-tRNA hydrolase [Granulosicoccaceae sp. 1_MG-2023]
MSQEVAFDLIAGLGNPGPQYEETRHNAGFWFLDELAARYQGVFRPDKQFAGEVCKVRVGQRTVTLLKPMTFMNRSGQSIASLAAYYRIPAERVLVVHDELDLPVGAVRIKQGGGHGGHNGLRDTIARLGKDFWRVRLGIGHPGHKDDVVSYVLARTPKSDHALIMDAIADCMQEFGHISGGELNKAMQALHSRKPA